MSKIILKNFFQGFFVAFVLIIFFFSNPAFAYSISLRGSDLQGSDLQSNGKVFFEVGEESSNDSALGSGHFLELNLIYKQNQN